MKSFQVSWLALLLAATAAQALDGTPQEAVELMDEVQAALGQLSQIGHCFNVTAAYDGAQDILVSDSLVSKLSCSKLSPQNVLTFVSKDAFTEERHMPIRNWSSGVLGQCWSLGLFQRQLFYLARFGVPGSKSDPEYVLNLARGTNADACQAKNGFVDENNQTCVEPVTEKKVFKIPETVLSGRNYYRAVEPGSLMGALSSHRGRSLRTEIEARQKRSFFSPGNLGMLFSSRERSESANLDTIEAIKKGLDQGRMPLIVIRAATSAQHVVLIKSIEKEKLGENRYLMKLYDSNQPYRDAEMVYSDGQFYAPDVIGLFFRDRIQAPVGVFLKDEEEMDDIQKANYDYYSSLCKKIKETSARRGGGQ
ncbi:MAG: hypothetical protein NDJ90_12850 [Oligoflexia bacterium]|nr:hypothetical protein [Oligoflexia bacterium]